MDINTQLNAELRLQGEIPLVKNSVIVGGMGGSRLPAEFFRAMFPKISVTIWKSYGLPPETLKNAFYIASSYSGNTKETLSFFDEARAQEFNLAVIAGGGELLELARTADIPYVQIPWEEETQARRMLPAALRALSLVITGKDDVVQSAFATAERSGAYARGGLLSGSIPIGAMPVFYASEKNRVMAEYAKIEVAETAHILASAGTFPEFLHNELAAYARENTHITPVFIFDSVDDERAVKDARHAMRFLEKKGYAPIAIELNEKERTNALAESCFMAQGLADALLRDRVPTSDFMREFRKEK